MGPLVTARRVVHSEISADEQGRDIRRVRIRPKPCASAGLRDTGLYNNIPIPMPISPPGISPGIPERARQRPPFRGPPIHKNASDLTPSTHTPLRPLRTPFAPRPPTKNPCSGYSSWAGPRSLRPRSHSKADRCCCPACCPRHCRSKPPGFQSGVDSLPGPCPPRGPSPIPVPTSASSRAPRGARGRRVWRPSARPSPRSGVLRCSGEARRSCPASA